MSTLPAERPPGDGAAWAEAIMDAVVRTLALQEAPLAPELRSRRGRWKDGAASLSCRAYQSGAIRFARLCLVRGEDLAIGNVLVVGDPSRGHLPVLGIDVVQSGARALLVAADLTPMGVRDLATRNAMAATAARRAPLTSAGELPAWAARWFTPHALFARAAADPAPLWLALRDVATTFLVIAQTPRRGSEDAGAIAGRQQRYLDDHRTEDRTLSMLGKIFDPSWAERFVAGVLFPTALSDVWADGTPLAP